MAIFKVELYAGEIITTTVTVLVIIYLWFQYKFTYWSKRNVPGPKPVFPFGNLRDVFTRKKQFFEPYYESYNNYKHLPFVGMYCFHKPILCINDAEIARLVLIKDFEHFQSHGTFAPSEQNDPLAGHLFNIHGEKWKSLRLKMSSAFSSSKLRSMYQLVNNVAKEAMMHLDNLVEQKQTINISEFYETYTMEIIASVGYGVEFKGYMDSSSEFYIRVHEYFEPKSKYWSLVRALAFFDSDLFDKLKLKRFSPGMEDFFYGLVQKTVEYRQNNAYVRNDFLQNMIELKNNAGADENGNTKGRSSSPFTMDDLAANTMLYMAAGYETSSTVGQLTAYELALNPRIQDKARAEVNRVLAEHQGEFTYEAQNEMTYLNMIFDETMRKYPPMRALFRRCNKDYKLPNHDLVIEEGTLVVISSQGLHMDPDLYPDPEKFSPERFLPENKSSRHPCHWMPFGEGPRKCLGLRQGYIQVKIALAKILQKYEIHLDERTLVPVVPKTTAFSYSPTGGIWINLKEISKTS